MAAFWDGAGPRRSCGERGIPSGGAACKLSAARVGPNGQSGTASGRGVSAGGRARRISGLAAGPNPFMINWCTAPRIVTGDSGRTIKELWIEPPPSRQPPPTAVLERPPAGGEATQDALPERARARLGSRQFRLESHISASAVSPDGRTVAGGGNQSVRLWDVDTGRLRARWPSRGYALALAFSPDGRRLASLNHDKGLRITDAA